jgi:hypothetical protein
MHWLNAPQLADPLPFTPVEDVSSGAAISRPRVLVADVDSEVFEKAQRGPISCPGDQRRNDDDSLFFRSDLVSHQCSST